MRTLFSWSMLLFVLGNGASVHQEVSEFPKPTGPYLGQKPPGVKPEVFAPGIISTEAHEFSCSFTPDGKEFYFTRRDPAVGHNLIMVTKIVEGVWTKPDVVPFVGNTMSFEPRVTPDGQRLYFTFERAVPGQKGIPMNIWYVQRQGTDWGAPQNPGFPFNPMNAMYISATRDGTMYATDISGGPGNECIAVTKTVEGKYQKFERLGPPINVGARDMYPFIAPDESYLVFASNRPAEGINSGLFISFRTQDGSWSDPRGVDIGFKVGLPIVSPDGKFLFFTAGERGRSDIYWVDAKIIEKLRPKKD